MELMDKVKACHDQSEKNQGHEKYKRTEIGVIPKDWEVKRLGDVLKVRHGKSQHDVVAREGEYPILGTGGEIGRTNNYLYDKPSVLIGRKGTIDTPQYMETRFWTIDTLFYTELLSGTLAKFIFYKFITINWRNYNEASGVPSLNASTIENIEISFPPLFEQTAIATVLSDIDALIDKLDELIAKKRDLKQATMQQLLTGKMRLPGFSGEWEIMNLGDIANFHKGKGLGKIDLDPFGSEPCIHYGELFTQYPETILKVKNRTNIKLGVFRSIGNDVLMPTSDVTPNGLAIASCVHEAGIILGGDILVIRSDPKKLYGSFLSYVIRQSRDQVMQLVTGTTVFHLYASDMKRFTLAIPTIQEQIEIVSLLDNINFEIAALEARRDKTRLLKQGTMQELLTGRIRLV